MTRNSLLALLTATLIAGCTSLGQKQLDSVMLSNIQFREEALTNVLNRMNALLEATCSAKVMPRIAMDFTIPKVVKRANSPAMEAEMDRCIEEFRQRNTLSNLCAITLMIDGGTVWQLLNTLPKIEPRIRVKASSPGAVIALAAADNPECRAYPMEPIEYDWGGHPHVISEQQMQSSADAIKVCFPNYALLKYAYPLKAYLFIASPKDQKKFASFLNECTRISNHKPNSTQATVQVGAAERL